MSFVIGWYQMATQHDDGSVIYGMPHDITEPRSCEVCHPAFTMKNAGLFGVE